MSAFQHIDVASLADVQALSGSTPEAMRSALNLIPENTRTVTSAAGLAVMHGNNGGIAERVLGRIMSPKRRVKQYVLSQDHFRRPQANFAMREPGTRTKRFEPRISNRTLTLQGYGLHSRMNGEDIAEADEGLPIRELKQFALASLLDLELESQFIAYATTGANYSTGHTGAVTNWDAAAGDPIGDIDTAKAVIMTDTGGFTGGGAFEWVLSCGYDVWVALKNNADIVDRWNQIQTNAPGVPSMAFVAGAIGVDRIEVSTMAAGTATPTSSLPVVTSNTFAWAATNDTASLMLQSSSVGATGSLVPGQFTCASMVSQYGRQSDAWFGGPELRGPEGEVEFVQMLDDWLITPIAVDDVATPTMTAGYLFTDCLA